MFALSLYGHVIDRVDEVILAAATNPYFAGAGIKLSVAVRHGVNWVSSVWASLWLQLIDFFALLLDRLVARHSFSMRMNDVVG